MSATAQMYRVLKPGIRQRAGAGWRAFDVGEVIEVTAVTADVLLPGGFIGPLEPGFEAFDHKGFLAFRRAEPAPTAAPATEPEGHEAVDAQAGRCPDHPRYQGRGEPRKGCQACARLHAEAHAHEDEVLP